MKTSLFCLALTAAAASAFAAPRMDRTKFHLGGYYFKDNIADEAHVKELAECGMDFMVGVPVTSRKTLDLFQKHGIGAVVGGVVPGWCGGGSNCFHLAQLRPRPGYVAGLDKFVKELDHPAIWMIDVTDEPGAGAFEFFGDICRLFREKCPDVKPYVNLFPNYARPYDPRQPDVETHLCIGSYKEYIDFFTETFPLDYISYDHYMMRDDPKVLQVRFFENLRVVADACRRSGRDLWFIPGVNTTWKNRRVSENQLRYQAFGSMAYGCVSIAWACWCHGWWNFNVYDKEGKRDDIQFNALKTVNLEIRKMADEFMKYRNVATRLCSFDALAPSVYHDGWITDLRPDRWSPFVVGEMTPRDETSLAHAAFVFAAGDPDDKLRRTHRFTFACAGKPRAVGPAGALKVQALGGGRYAFTIKDSEAALVICE